MKNEFKFLFRVAVILFASLFFMNNATLRIKHNFNTHQFNPINLSIK